MNLPLIEELLNEIVAESLWGNGDPLYENCRAAFNSILVLDEMGLTVQDRENALATLVEADPEWAL